MTVEDALNGFLFVMTLAGGQKHATINQSLSHRQKMDSSVIKA